MMLVVSTFLSETEYSTSVIVTTRNSGITCQEKTILRTKRLVHSLPVSYLTTRDGSPDLTFSGKAMYHCLTRKTQLSSLLMMLKWRQTPASWRTLPLENIPVYFIFHIWIAFLLGTKQKKTVAQMRRGIKNLQSVIAARKEEIYSSKDTGRSRNEQGKQFLPLSVEELVHSEKFILRCLQYHYFN